MEFQNILTNLSQAADDIVRYEIIKKLDDRDILKLATLNKQNYISDTLWFKILKDKCGGLYKDYNSIDEFNTYNHTTYTRYKEAIIDGIRLTTEVKIIRGMVDLMWINFNKRDIDNYSRLLTYLSYMPQYTLERLKKVLDKAQIGSILTKQHKYDQAYEYFNNANISISNCYIYFDLLYTAEYMHENVMERYKDELRNIYEYYRAWSDNATFEDKLKYGRFKYITEDVDYINGDILVKGIKAALVREDEDIYAFIDRYNQLIHLTSKQFIKVAKYIDDRQILNILLQHTDIDSDVIKWCMYDEKLLNMLSKMVDMYVEDIVDDDLIDVTRLVDAGFKLRSNEIVVRGYVLYPPKQYNKQDFIIVTEEGYIELSDDYYVYMLNRYRNFLLHKDMDIYATRKFMKYIIRLYRFDNEIIHKLINKFIVYSDKYVAQYIMIKTNLRSELGKIINIDRDDIHREYIRNSILKEITKRVNIKYIEYINFNYTYIRDEIINILLECENLSIYKPLLLFQTLVKNKSIRNMISQIRNIYQIKLEACDKNRAYPLQYIGEILNVDFNTFINT